MRLSRSLCCLSAVLVWGASVFAQEPNVTPLAAVSGKESNPHRIAWRSATDPGWSGAITGSIGQAMRQQAEAGRRHLVVRFNQPIGQETRDLLQTAGVELLSYVGADSYFASVVPGRLNETALDQVGALGGVQVIEREHKLHPMLVRGEIPPWAVVSANAEPPLRVTDPVVGAYVIFHRDVPLESEAADLCARHGATLRSFIHSINGAVIELPYSQIETLATEDGVQWIEPPQPRLEPVNDSVCTLTQASLAQAAPYNLTGAGVTVLVYDGGTGRATHVDFQGRLHVRDNSGMADHPTHVAGTIGGAGIANATYKGMAPGVTLEAYGCQNSDLYADPGDLESNYSQAINTYGADISNNSIGSNVEINNTDCALQGDYGGMAATIDAVVRGSLGQPFRVIWAAGNERQAHRCDVEGYGDYYSMAPPSGAKNHIAVGAVNSNDDSMTSFSSWGPMDDGRLKPDLCAPGCQVGGDGGVTSCLSTSDTAYGAMCGTSMASPTICGLSALLLQDYRAKFPGRPDFRNSTLKILLAQCAVDRGNAGPDYQFGYGSVRIKDTIDFMRTGNFLENSISQGGVYTVYVPVTAGTATLKATLAWDDFPAASNVSNILVNDLDLRVFNPSNTRYYPWTLDPLNPSVLAVRTAEDHRNNIEQVLVNAPTAGTWRIEVYGSNVPQGPQPFSLCASPGLSACKGEVLLDASQYNCGASVGVNVYDCDLDTNSGLFNTATVTVTSTSDPTGRSVMLTETGPATGYFHGTLPLSSTGDSGTLRVSHGDMLTARYVDANNGQGGYNVETTATATLDCQFVVITNVQISNISAGSATVTFATNEPAKCTVRYGLTCGSLTNSVAESGYGTAHSLTLSGLPSNAKIYLAVEAADLVGNLSVDNQQGQCYWFTTPALFYSWNMDTDPNWTISGGEWAWGPPTGGGGAYGNPDPTSGHTGANVYGYNLSGDYANDLPEYHLTTNAIDCTQLRQVSLSFWRWLGVQRNSSDHAYLRVSSDGVNWTTIWQNPGSSLLDAAWGQQTYDLSAVADGQPTVYLRWTMGTTNSSRAYCGWNIDDVEIWGIVSEAAPPTPNPLIFATPPAPTSTTTVTMTATTATDAASPPVAYYFNFVSGGPGGNDSGWQASTSYLDTGLSANTAYTYRVKARDSAPVRNETGYSANASTATFIETPTGLSLGAVTATSIDLNVTGLLSNLTTGTSGVYFDSTTAGGHGGINAWVQTPGDTATGLIPNTTYTFQVKARNQNAIETAYGSTVSKTTLAEVPAAPVLSAVDSGSMQIQVAPNGNPPATELAIRCVGTNPPDSYWQDKYVSDGGGNMTTAIWSTAATWGTHVIESLIPGTTYTFAVKARNLEGIETAFGPSASLATAWPVGACCHSQNHDCTEGTEAECLAAGGEYQGHESLCASGLCSSPCALTGDVNQDGVVNGLDVPGFIRAKLAEAPVAGENPSCAGFSAGTLEGDIAAFIVACLGSLPDSPCSLLGDLNQDGVVNGLDVPGFIRAKLGEAPVAGENPSCAGFSAGTLEGDTVAFINALLL